VDEFATAIAQLKSIFDRLSSFPVSGLDVFSAHHRAMPDRILVPHPPMNLA
jgi:hypothetical protein